jgi:hypothetical protein
LKFVNDMSDALATTGLIGVFCNVRRAIRENVIDAVAQRKQQQPAPIVMAVPVASVDGVERLRREADGSCA